MLEKRLQDRYASANETRVDLDNAPEKSLGGQPWTVFRCEVSHGADEADDGDGPIPKDSISLGRSRSHGLGRTHTEPIMKITDTPILSLRDSCIRQTIGSGKTNMSRSVIKFREP